MQKRWNIHEADEPGLFLWLEFFHNFFQIQVDMLFDFIYSGITLWGVSEAGLSRWPVTPETTGSSPVHPD